MMFNQTQSIPKSYWFFIFLCLLAVVVVIVVSAPSKLFIDNQNGGLRLFRDDQFISHFIDGKNILSRMKNQSVYKKISD